MKRFILLAVFIVLNAVNAYALSPVTVDTLVSADDLTIAWLNGFKNTVVNALNSFPGGNIQADSLTEAAFDDNTNPETRWGEAFNEFVYSGLLAPTATGLASTTTAGTAYIKNDTTGKMTRVVKDATAHTYTASKDTYVDLSTNGVYTYSEVANGAAAPAVASNSIRLFKAVTNGTDVTSVTDLRVTGIQLSTSEDFYIKGMELIYTDSVRVSTDSGIVYNGATRIAKVSATGLDISSTAYYITGASERAANIFLHVYCDDDGNIKLDANNPDYADTSGNTVGTLRYYKYGTDYWRYLGSVSLDSSQNIARFYQNGDNVYYDVPILVINTVSDGAWFTAHVPGMPVTSTEGQFQLYVKSNVSDYISKSIRPTNGTKENPSTTVGDIIAGDSVSVGGVVNGVTNSSQNIDTYDFKSGGALTNSYVKLLSYRNKR